MECPQEGIARNEAGYHCGDTTQTQCLEAYIHAGPLRQQRARARSARSEASIIAKPPSAVAPCGRVDRRGRERQQAGPRGGWSRSRKVWRAPRAKLSSRDELVTPCHVDRWRRGASAPRMLDRYHRRWRLSSASRGAEQLAAKRDRQAPAHPLAFCCLPPTLADSTPPARTPCCRLSQLLHAHAHAHAHVHVLTLKRVKAGVPTPCVHGAN